MRNRIIFTIGLLLVLINADAKQDSIKILWRNINVLNSNNQSLQKINNELVQKLSNLSTTFDSIEKVVQFNTLHNHQIADSLGIIINKTETASTQKYDELSASLSKSTLYGILIFLLLFLNSIFIYFFLSKRQKSDKTELFNQIVKTRIALEQEFIKVYTKITEIHQSQRDLLKLEKTNIPKGIDPDHSLAKKVNNPSLSYTIRLIFKTLFLIYRGMYRYLK